MEETEMRIQWNLSVVLICAFGLAVVASCSPSGSVSNDNTNDNANTNQNGGDDVDANVTFPDVSGDAGDDSELINISDEGGIAVSFFGGTDGDESTATISRIEGTTGEDSLVASFDSNLRTDRVTIGDTEIELDYDTEDMFTYTVSRGEETVFSGSGLVAIRTDAALQPEAWSAKPSGRAVQQVDPEDVAACRDELLSLFAELAEQVGAPDAGSTPSAEFIACLEEVNAVRRIASALCAVQLVFAPALEEVVTECTSHVDPLRCLNRALPAITSMLSLYSTLNVVLIDIIFQLYNDVEFCASS